MKRLVWVIIGVIGLGGCASLLDEEFRKARLVTAVQFGSPKIYKRTLDAPPGAASVIVAVPNYRCVPVPDGRFTITVTDERGIIFTERLRLSQLTWSYGVGSCDAYGHLYSSSANVTSPGQGEMRIDISGDKKLLTFEIDVSQLASSPPRRANVWLIYGDRVPGAEIFKDKG
jgi:hypothetical protein